MKFNRTFLANGCSFSQPAVNPSNWKKPNASVKVPWYFTYRFYDPLHREKYPNGKQVHIRGMNDHKSAVARKEATEILLAYELDRLTVQGYNPITGTSIPLDNHRDTDIVQETTFPRALRIAAKLMKCEKSTREDIDSMLTYVDKAIYRLNFQHMPVCQVTRRHVLNILNITGEIKRSTKTQCKGKNVYGKWSAHAFNKYRAYLMSLFRIIVKFEAIENNPVLGIDKEVPLQRIRETLTPKERKEVDEKLKLKFYTFWRFIHIFFHSGARRNEIMLIQAHHVEIEKQRVKYIVKKGRAWREVYRPIKDIVLPLWVEVMKDCKPDDYLFSDGLVPGSKPIRPDQITKRWNRHIKNKLNITADFYSLKHINTTETVDRLNDADAAAMNAHTSTAMVVQIYDVNREARQQERLKKIDNSFS